MIPWMTAALAWALSIAGTGYYAFQLGKDSETAAQARIAQAVQDTREAAQKGAADAISKIKIVNTTVRQKAETVVRTERLYTDCRHSPGMRDAINAAISGRSLPTGNSELPAPDAAGR